MLQIIYKEIDCYDGRMNTSFPTTPGKRVKQAREQIGLSQRKLAQLLGLSRQYISMIELDKFESLRSSLLVKMSTILETSVEYLAEGKEYERNFSIRVPILLWKDVGLDMFNDDKNKYKSLPLVGTGTQNSFVLINDTVTMYSDSPLFSECFFKGDYLYFDPNKEAKDGDYIVVRQKNAESAIFRKFVKENDQFYLVPLNSQFEAIPFTPDYKICGVLIARVNLFEQKENNN
jgi:SOS-response transcriptional repressor LexA